MTTFDLFRFVVRTHAQRGWGRALRSAVAQWYAARPVVEVAADILKCPEYEGWTHRDLLRLAHPLPPTPAHNALFQWVADGQLGHLTTPALESGELRQVYAVERLRTAGEESEALNLIERYALTHEMVPEQWKRTPAIWETLLTNMSYSDIVDNLIALGDSGLLAEESPATALVVARLIDRRRAQNSGLSADDLARTASQYASHSQANGVVLDALAIARELLERERASGHFSEN